MTDRGIRAIIFANGVMDSWPPGLEIDPEADLIIAADGGLAHCLAWGHRPLMVVGDLDSADPGEVDRLAGQGVEIVRHPARKDDTDLELALNLAVARGAVKVTILGGLGARWDMTLANTALLASGAARGVDIRLMDGGQTITCLQGPGRAALTGRPGDILSLIPLSDPASGITLHGLEYPLNRAVLPRGSSRGVSNVFVGQGAEVELESGCLLIVTIAGGGAG